MQFLDVLNQLQDLPLTFKRVGPNYTALENSFGLALSTYTVATDGVLSQLNFQNAEFFGIGIWGTIFGVSQNVNESDTAYKTRIVNTLEAWFCTIPGLIRYMSQVYNISASVTESGASYTLTFSTPSVSTLIILENLNLIRPAGVPFYVNLLSGGLYLNTINYVGSWRVTGSYLTSPVSNYSFTLPSTTNNSPALFPTTLISSPLLSISI